MSYQHPYDVCKKNDYESGKRIDVLFFKPFDIMDNNKNRNEKPANGDTDQHRQRQSDPAGSEDNPIIDEETHNVSGAKKPMSNEDEKRARRASEERRGEEE